MFTVQTEVSEETDMAAGNRSGVYRDVLCGQGLSYMVMGGIFRSGIPKSGVKVLLNQS